MVVIAGERDDISWTHLVYFSRLELHCSFDATIIDLYAFVPQTYLGGSCGGTASVLLI